MLTIAALRPYPPAPPPPGSDAAGALGGADVDKDHGPREGLPDLMDLPVVLQERAEPHLRPVVQVPGRVAEVAQVGAAGHVEHAPERLAWHGYEQPAAGDARHLREGLIGLRHVLEHLDGAGHVELAVGEREV